MLTTSEGVCVCVFVGYSAGLSVASMLRYKSAVEMCWLDTSVAKMSNSCSIHKWPNFAY